MKRLTMSMCASRDYMQGWNDCAEKAEARVAELESALAACIERLEQVSDDSESTSFIESCQPVITQAKVALYPEQ